MQSAAKLLSIKTEARNVAAATNAPRARFRMKVEENSYTIKIIYVSSSKLDSIAEKLCKTYYQQSVLVEDEINNRAYFKKHPLVQPNMDTLERDNVVLFKAFEEFKLRKKEIVPN